MGVKKKFREEKQALEAEKKRLLAQVEELKGRQEATEQRFYQYRKEVEESPLSVMRAELAQKEVERIELESRLKQA